MPSKNPAQRLLDILENIEWARQFTAGMRFEEFVRDRKTAYAVNRALEIISEASRRLPAEIRARHSEIDWRRIAAAGNVYRHDYDAVDPEFLWKTLNEELHPLEQAVRIELARVRGD